MADPIADHEKRITKLESWRDGNGLMGAALTIQTHEGRIDEIENHHIQEPQILQEAVSIALSKRSKSKEGLIRAWGPYFAALCVIVTAVLERVL